VLLAGCGVVVTEQSQMAGLAEEFAAAWSAGRLADAAALTDDPDAAEAALDRTTDQMGAPPDLVAATADKSDGTVDAELSWSLDAGRTWTYTTTWHLLSGSGRQLDWRPSVIHPAMLEGQSLTVRQVPGQRGDLLDRTGQPLMTTRPVVTVLLTPAAAGDAADVAGALGAALQRVDPTVDIAELVAEVTGAPPAEPHEILTLRQEEYQAVKPLIHDLPGVTFLEGSRVLGPTRTFAQPLLGRVGHPTAERLEELGAGYTATDDVGVSGLQEALEERLAGTAGSSVSVLRADGSADRELQSWPGTAGASVTLSLDSGVQVAAEEALETVPQSAAIVAVQPSTGELLAVADSGTTQALTGLYPPGSTFKAITAAAVLGAGLSELDTVVPCPETIDVNGQRIRNDPGVGDRGTITFQQAFAHSCNTSFIGYAGVLAPEAFPSTAEQFGIGVDFLLPGAATNSGSAPAPGTANEAAEDSIGQGKIQASPFAMAMVAATVAHGSLPRPVLVQGEPATADRTVPAPDPELLDSLRQMMRSVVTYGSARSLADLGEVHGKTGTAQFGDGTQAHGWFIGYRGDLAFAVFVEAGESSHGSAVPVAETLLEQLP
jgi:cell division protein FtsI/penicillin-binding protein 2